MGFLDDVKNQQAAEKAARSGQPVEQVESMRPPHVQAVAPGLEMMAAGMGAFARRLAAALPDIQASYDLEIYGRLTGLRQAGYRFATTPDLKLQLSFTCKSSETVEFSTTSRETCDRILDELIQAGLKVRYRSHADWKFIFSVTPVVPVSIELEPHEFDSVARLTSKNLDHIGTQIERLRPDQLDENLLEQLKHCVLRKPNQFFELLGNRVSQDLRDQFKEQIAMRQHERDQQLAAKTQDSSYAGALGCIKELFGLRSKE